MNEHTFQIGDIISYNDPIFDDSKHFVSSYFVVSKIVDDMYYYMLPLNDELEEEQYLIDWVDGSSKWKKIS